MIREATHEDIPDLVRMSRKFVEALGRKPNNESIIETLEFLINDKSGIILMQDRHAMIGGLTSEVFFDRDDIGATELFWWVEEQFRGSGAGIALLNGLESWSRSIGASRLSMMAMESLGADVAGIYKKHGYTKWETAYVKEL